MDWRRDKNISEKKPYVINRENSVQFLHIFLLYYYFYGYGSKKEYHAVAKDINWLFSQTDIYLWLKVRGLYSELSLAGVLGVL